MSTTIAIQGVQASFHDIAARQYFGAESGRVFCDTFASTFAALSDDRADYILCALENSLYGSINEVYDLLLSNDFHIIGEVYLRIEQCLIGLPEAQLEAITEVHSHPVALAQCERYLDDILPYAERMEYHDTAASVEMISRRQDPTIAAIGSRQSAELYGMQVLSESIETDSQNYTRFVVLGKQPGLQKDTTKTSFVLRTNHTPGALYHALGSFAKRDINLTKLQSRPIVGKAWRYIFYVDVAIGGDDPAFAEVLSELESQECQAVILGSYQSGMGA